MSNSFLLIADLQTSKSLIKGIAQNIVRYNKPNARLSDCLSCSSSTLQESDVSEHGTYPVYGANGIVGYLDNYNAENEAIYIANTLISIQKKIDIEKKMLRSYEKEKQYLLSKMFI